MPKAIDQRESYVTCSAIFFTNRSGTRFGRCCLLRGKEGTLNARSVIIKVRSGPCIRSPENATMRSAPNVEALRDIDCRC